MAATPSILSVSETTEQLKLADNVSNDFGIRNLYNHCIDLSPRNVKWSEFQDLILEEKHLKER